LAVELEHLGVEPADDQQRRGAHLTESGGGEVGTPAARDDRRYLMAEVGGGDQRGGGTGAGAEVTERQLTGLGLAAKPAGGGRQSPAKQGDVEHVGSVALLLGGEQIEQERREPVVVQRLGDLAVAGAQTA
jgi:hypothetical protein